MINTYVAFDYKWILSSKKLNYLKSGKYPELKKFLCKTQHGDWSLKLCRRTLSKTEPYSFRLVVERENVGKKVKNVITIMINLYTINQKQHIFQKRFVQILRRRSLAELNLGYHIKKMVENSAASIISGRVFIKMTSNINNTENCPAEVETNPSDELSNDFCKLCCNEFGSDIILSCNSENFPAHKLILAARCPYFAELFQNSKISQFDIMDLKPDVLKAMLFYIYSAKTEQLTQELASDLLTASTTYKLKSLKIICVNYLRSIMTIENIIPIYVFAVATDEELKIHALNYISSKFTLIENTNEWQNLLKEKPAMATQILSSIVKATD